MSENIVVLRRDTKNILRKFSKMKERISFLKRRIITNESQLKRFVRMMILKQSKKRRTLFRRRKFDVLIRSDLTKNLSTKNVLYYIDKISFSYLFVWAHYFII
jgi:hypothetical protein